MELSLEAPDSGAAVELVATADSYSSAGSRVQTATIAFALMACCAAGFTRVSPTFVSSQLRTRIHVEHPGSDDTIQWESYEDVERGRAAAALANLYGTLVANSKELDPADRAAIYGDLWSLYE